MDLRAKALAGMDYQAYRALVDQCVADHRTTGPEQSAKRIEATRVNQARMRRLDKTVVLSDELREALLTARPGTWIVLTETWCGDAAQNLPVLAAMATVAGTGLRILLRDEHLDLMDDYLTNGTRSIPKLIAIDGEGRELFNWGPRPAGAHVIVTADKALPEAERMPYEKLTETVHRWYHSDATQALQGEMLALLKAR